MSAKEKYHPGLIPLLLKHAEQGLSYESFAAVAGVTRATLYRWEKKYEAWAEAKEQFNPISLLTWERLGIGLVSGKIKGAQAAFIHQICNRFPDLYRHRVEIDGKLQGDFTLHRTRRAEGWTDEQLQSEIAKLEQIANA